MKQRVLSILLVLALLLSAAPVYASAAQNEAPKLETGDITATGTSSFGNLLAEEIRADQAETNGASYIQSIDISGNTATVAAETLADCTLIVGIYSEDGRQMYTSAKATLPAGNGQTTLNFDNALPDYFLVKGFLVDSKTYAPLCNEYVTPMYTQQMQELLAMTTDDFEADRVLNLDASRDNNFAVYADGTIIIEPVEGYNTVSSADETTGIYIFEHIDTQISALQAGDTFAYEYEPGNILIVKVGDIAITGATATIEAVSANMDDVFDYVKIDTSDTLEHAEIDNSNLEDGVTYDGLVEPDPDTKAIDDTYKKGIAVKYTLDKKWGKDDDPASVKFSGSFEFSAEVSLEYYLSLKYASLTFKLEYSAKLGAEVSAKLALVEIPLGSIDFSPVPGVYIGLTPKVVLEVSAKISFELEYSASLGYKATFGQDIKASIENTSTRPKTECEITIDGKVFFGVDLEPHVKIISDAIAKASMDATAGLEIKGELKPVGEDDQEGHLCAVCVDGEVSYKLKLTVGVELLKHFELEATLSSFTRKIADFYWSLTYGEFGWGDCPHVDDGGGSGGVGGAWDDGTHGERTDSGSCGENVYWELFEDGSLHIYGTGEMDDYAGNSPWFSLQESIITATIDPGVTSIGDKAFYICRSLTEVSIPNSVTSIGKEAFYWCDNLTSVTIPDGVASIAVHAFYSCRGLTSVAIPKSVISIDAGAFNNCVSLTGITIPDSVTSIGDFAFSGCDNLASVMIGNNVVSIGNNAFSQCGSLTNVTIPRNVVSIGKEAFTWCDSLTKIVFQGNAPEIGADSFYDVTATVYYPADNATWTAAVQQNYGGTLTWVPYTGTPPTAASAPALRSSVRTAGSAAAQLLPNQSYLLVVARDKSAADLLSSDNLLFLDQQQADSSGQVSFQYLPITSTVNPYVAIYGPEGVTVLTGQSCDGGDHCPSAKFVDVDKNQWYHNAIDFAITNNIFSGIDATHFNPNGKTTRAMFVAVLWRLDGRPESNGASPFVDVKASDYFTKAVIWAAENKIVAGADPTHFNPSGNVTREQVAAFLYRYSRAKGYDLSTTADLSAFPDAGKVEAYAQTNLSWAVGSGLISGNKDNATGIIYLDPKGNATRAQVAQILMKFTQNVAE